MAQVHLRGVKKSYDKLEVIHGIDMEITDGEFIVIVGPSGCGKSTLLRMVAGLERITGGQVAIGDRVVNELEPKDRDIAMVFQNYALYPHFSVYENMAYGLKIRGVPKAEIEQRVQKAAKILELGQLLQRRPRQLSGGQRQRVAIGRALVRDAAVFLFDEPLSNLDAKLRNELRVEIKRLHARLGKTTMVYVTHDQIEAMTLADRIVVMKEQKIQQIGTPDEIYHRPANLFVAGFIGSPKMNFVNGEVATKLGAMTVGVRPEHITLSRDSGVWQGTVSIAEHLGSDTFLHIKADGIGPMTARVSGEMGLEHGDTVFLTPAADKMHKFDAEGRKL